GVEVRQSTLDAQALSRLEGGPGFARWNLPVHGWAVAFDTVSWQLQLPPGWRLLSATAEQVRGSWLERWTIWDVFLVLLTVAAAGRVLGRRWAFVALPMAVLLYPESPGLISALLVVLAMLALVRLPLRGMGARLVRGMHLLAQLALVVGTLSLVVEQVRLAIYPQLERYASLPGEGHEYADSAMASAPVMAQDMATLSRMREEYAPKRAAAPASPAPEPLPDWDPDARIQTGPGVPAWRWNSAYLSWQGPVESEDSVTVYLLSPGWVSFARVLMALLIGALVLQCLRSAMTLRPPEEPGGHPGALALWPGLALMLALGGGLGAPTPLQAAELPDPAWLDRQQTRLLEAPPCTPTCVAEQDTWLVVDGDALTLTLSVNALAQGVLRIPAHREAWLPSDILLDGQGGWPARMGEDGFLRVAIPPGQHELVLEGRLQGADAWEIRWPERPHAFRIDVRGWRTQGVRDAVLQGNSLRIERDARIDKPAADAQATLFPDPIAPFVQVERTLVLGQRWELISRVVRKAPARGAIAVSLPLWPGEQVLSRDLNVRDGRIDVVLGAEQEQVLWRSALDPVDRIELAAETGVPWHEIWRVRPGMPWHLRSQLLEPVEWVNAAGQWQPEWWPRAGERLLLQVQRPQAVVGPTLTVDRLKLNHSPGAQRARIDLTLDLRTSLGERLHWPLPTGWTLREVQIDGVPQGRTRQADVMDLALTPGTHRVTASIDSDSPMRGYLHLEAPMVPWPVANLEQQVEVPGDRWLLLARGPGVGPAVLYWGVLPVIVVLAWGLGRHTGNPLGMGAWLLLGIGLSLSEAWHALLVAGWFYAMAWRGRQVVDPVGWRFNLRQMGLVLFSVVTLLVLIGNVPTGLLGQPDMWVSGNGSGAGHLRWYTDRVAEGSLPLPAIFSLPLWVYRLLMLGWLRWGWQCLTQGGGFGPWRSGKASVVPAAEASTPAVSAAEPDSSADPRV
ncbi:MAG: hypothetical protein LPK85_12140, partial [Gammaproteobacteria bacterium]|nr:hypothetical protein [Gammaproteobacteria bacterium]